MALYPPWTHEHKKECSVEKENWEPRQGPTGERRGSEQPPKRGHGASVILECFVCVTVQEEQSIKPQNRVLKSGAKEQWRIWVKKRGQNTDSIGLVKYEAVLISEYISCRCGRCTECGAVGGLLALSNPPSFQFSFTPGCILWGWAAGWCLWRPQRRNGCSPCRWRTWNGSRLSCHYLGSSPQTSSRWTPDLPVRPAEDLEGRQIVMFNLFTINSDMM